MTTAIYTVPDNPADPEAAALDLIVRTPTEILGDDSPPLEVLQQFTALLHGEGAFAGMTWHDAKHAAVAIIVDAVNQDDAPAFLQKRARRALDGSDGMTWNDPAAMARALTIGAKVLGLPG
jgi:hypothetical protein